ncbi:hypothetical protein N7510_009675 [Penicillium lagena]|uniref:uncharacterized protein n=1 Tax=Penicillium lagena TaxID=94218 RepID=UPI0025404A0C|nr:uncharacterized protein N7510_009675 [Penicillium lagena]KAJ5604521.1 hypothetical protein N7510_009675 [Penicillium lagena]
MRPTRQKISDHEPDGLPSFMAFLARGYHVKHLSLRPFMDRLAHVPGRVLHDHRPGRDRAHRLVRHDGPVVGFVAAP